ncbi:Zinc finger, RanBP2-type [Dillenia turbinata]|uniref:Zinc finger, RanBP2-type n=1 Tax=Dillenia turbinata TaxID=194707 RepID=A0AAN8YWW9_9MAGN
MSRPGDWNCRSCHHLNFQRRDSCQRCGNPRPGERGGDPYGSFGSRGGSSASFGFTGADVRPGDWYCTIAHCGAHNFASRSSCFKCGAFKDESSGGFETDMPRPKMFGFGGGGGSSSRSNWKSGDWICTRCNEHNFASRTECFRCNAPRESGSKSSFS